MIHSYVTHVMKLLYTRNLWINTTRGCTSKDHRYTKYNCPDCGKGTDDKTEYSVHLAHHENLKRYKCNVCSQAFYSQSQLMTHVKNSCVSTTTTTKSFKCSVCGHQSKTEDRYREHFRSAHILSEDPQPFFCEDCISRYYSESSFNRHQGKCTGIV